MTSFRGRARGNPLAWSWSDAEDFLFEHSTPPDRLLSEDLGPGPSQEDFGAWLMQKALRETCERVAQLLTEAGLSPDDVSHLNANRDRKNVVSEFLEKQ